MPASMDRFSGSFTLTALAALLMYSPSHPAFSQAAAAASPAEALLAQAAPLRTDVRRVAVDVVVTDSQGRPVTGLTRDDFKVEEDKEPQKLRFFDVHDVHTVAPDANFVVPNIPALPPNTFLNLAKAPESGTPTVILYDALNTQIGDQFHGHRELLDLLRHRRPGTQIAVFVLIDKLHLLQGFTEDTGLLSAALASKKGTPQTTTLLAPSSGLAGTPASDNPMIGATYSDPGYDPDQAFFDFMTVARHFDTLDQDQLQDQRVELTLNALTDIGRFLASMPGRKDLIWLSSVFPLGSLPGEQQGHGESLRDYSGQIKQAADLLNRSHVSVYPVDIRGVRANSDLNAAANAAYGPNPTTGQNRMTTSTNLKLSQQKFIAGDLATRTTMDLIADDTGGHAFYGTNGLQEAVNSAMTSGSTYYSLTYEPMNPKYDGSLRHIKVTLKRPGYNLAYRRTYYADDLEAAAQKVADAPQNPLTPSLERGTPLAHDLFIEAHLDADGAPTPATPEQMQVLSQFGDAQTKKDKAKAAAPVLMQQYLISYGLAARQLDMPVDDSGAHRASLELGLISYDEDGRKLNGVDTHIDDPVPAANYARLLSDGYHVVQSVAVPVTAASIRVAVRDIRGNRIGSLEVTLPLAKTVAAKTPDLKPPAK